MSKWKCDICNGEFNNYHAEGFNNKIYCPLCYYKHEYKDLKQQLQSYKQKEDKIKEYCETTKEKYKFFDKSNTTDVSAILEIIGGNDDK